MSRRISSRRPSLLLIVGLCLAGSSGSSRSAPDPSFATVHASSRSGSCLIALTLYVGVMGPRVLWPQARTDPAAWANFLFLTPVYLA